VKVLISKIELILNMISGIIPFEVKCLIKIVWDWNGTLLNDVDLSFQCMNRLLAKNGLTKLKDLDAYRSVFEFPVEKYYQTVGFDFNKTPFSDLAHDYMADYQDKSYTCNLFADVLDTINKASDLGFYQAVLSASHKDYLLAQISNLRMESKFDSIWGIEDIYANSKEAIAHAFKETCTLDDEIWFVGDSLHDFEVANSIGANCILVSTGHQNRNRLSQANVKIVDSLKEGLDYIYERSQN
jgi:phosphoglycolate phosphatase